MEEGQWALIAGSAEGLGEDVSPLQNRQIDGLKTKPELLPVFQGSVSSVRLHRFISRADDPLPADQLLKAMC